MHADFNHPQPQYSKGSISIALVREALSAAQQQGLDTALILQKAGIAAELVYSSKARVSVSAYAQLWIALADHMNDEFFGMDSHPMRRGSYLLLSQLVMSAETLAQALHRTLKFLNAVLDDIHSEYVIVADQVQLILHDRAHPKRMFCYATYLMLIHGLLCWLAGQRIPLQQIQLKCQPPLDDQDYRVRFCDNIDYLADENRISFDADFLAIKIKQDRQTWYEFMRHTPHNLLIRFKNPNALSTRIRKHLMQVHPAQWLELNELAQRLNISEATIQRRLKQEGVSYQQLKNDIRRDTAIELLNSSQQSLQEISDALNFQDPSAFHRAFKKWTGVSPGAYRNLSVDEVVPNLLNQ